MTTTYGGLDTDAFELKRVMRQEAHEKAYEIKVLTQRLFEKEKEKIVEEGKHRIDNEMDQKLRTVQQDINIARSTQINKGRMELMNQRNDFMKKILVETLQKLEHEIALPTNPRYKKVLKDLMVQGCIKLLEEKILVKIRQKDLEVAKSVTDEAEREFKALMIKETGTEKQANLIKF